MSDELLDFTMPEKQQTFIKVIGVGGGGGNAVNYMCNQGIHNVDFIICNTDVQDFKKSPVATKIALGGELTGGHGAGSDAEVGEKAARESTNAIRETLEGDTRMVFITAGMGGGTGTGAAPVVAEIARDLGILTVGVVTLPFKFEGSRRLQQAIHGIENLSNNVDSLLIINNDSLREIHGDLKLSEAFSKADSILTVAVKGTVEIMTKAGQQNVDFNDVKKVLKDSGVAIMTTGSATGEDRAYKAVNEALDNPLLNKADIRGAKNALVNISYGAGDNEASMSELEIINELIIAKAGTDVDLKWGAVMDETLGEEIKVTLVATGFVVKDIPDFKNFNVTKPQPTGNSGNGAGQGNSQSYMDIRNAADISSFTHTPPEQREKIIYNPEAPAPNAYQQNSYQNYNESSNEPVPTITLLNTDNQFAKAASAASKVQTQQVFDYGALRGSNDISAWENQPAYMRKNQIIPPPNEVPQPLDEMQTVHTKSSTVSHISLAENADGIYLDKNKYVHRNVD
ncbi:MAG: cell division protein FtsZ [Bacteroidales bacterium]|jgi:cell division protein FtsZ|nr:cell division protein FtsZ [Bacteroidales bacterium]